MPHTSSSSNGANAYSTTPSPFRPRLRIVSRAATHEETIRLLMDEVEMRYGIVPSPALSKKLLKAFEHLPLAEFADWARRLSQLPATDREWLGLIEGLTLPEAYFNRHPARSSVLRRKILPELIRRVENDPSPTLRILSAGCATGEEAYDLSFLVLEALLEAGHAKSTAEGAIVVDPRWQVEVFGADLSREALEVGAAGIYSDHWLGSFQGIHQRMWRFFEGVQAPGQHWLPGVRHWRVKHFARRHVRFRRCDLLAGTPPVTDCDLTVCQELMVYLDQQGKLKAQQALARTLKPGSFLLQGPSDVQLLPELYHLDSDGELLHYRKK